MQQWRHNCELVVEVMRYLDFIVHQEKKVVILARSHSSVKLIPFTFFQLLILLTKLKCSCLISIRFFATKGNNKYKKIMS